MQTYLHANEPSAACRYADTPMWAEHPQLEGTDRHLLFFAFSSWLEYQLEGPPTVEEYTPEGGGSVDYEWFKLTRLLGEEREGLLHMEGDVRIEQILPVLKLHKSLIACNGN